MNSTDRTIRVNDQALEYVTGETLAALLHRLGFNPDAGGVALALNGRIIRQAEWAVTHLNPNDKVEVVTAKQGG